MQKSMGVSNQNYHYILTSLFVICVCMVIYASYITGQYGEYFSINPVHKHMHWTTPTDSNETSIKRVTSQNETAENTQILPYKYILLWNKVSWFSRKSAGAADICGNCPIIRDRNQINGQHTGAVLVEWESNPQNPPNSKQRRFDQLYVWWGMEGPSITKKGNPERFKLYTDNFFNATLTFRRDSTFYNPVWTWSGNISIANLVRNGFGGLEKDLGKLLQRKTKVAAWMVSNCALGSNAKRRIAFSQDLIDNGLKLDRFGKCFPKSGSTPRRYEPEFFRFIEQYKFYMSFENAIHCTDYITEKFQINALAAGVVPVVMGARKADYQAIAPPHSFIHVDDFASAKDLVEYLEYLDSNHTAYAEYLAWRTMDPYDLYPYGRHIGFCDLCRTMFGVSPDDHRPFSEIYRLRNSSYPANRPIRQYHVKSIYDWWFVSQTTECLG
uniref:Fucosyltransferase n=1 Tax=Phallusia mammillata TaxID=59560 RepID=A0A6F9DE04_9ASCI|nr:alpha-(1,3)-fucosyltransferase 9-like [Phallusia mammillata]